MRRLALLASLLLIVALAGCQPRGPRVGELQTGIDGPPPDMGRIVFYRVEAPLLVAVGADVIVNGRRVGTLEAGELFYRDARPGRYRAYTAGDPDSRADFAIAAGETRYVRISPGVHFPGFRLSAELVDAARAAGEIDALAFVGGRTTE